MQISSRTIVSVVGTVSMVVLTIVLAAVSPHQTQQVQPASTQQTIVAEH